MRKGVFPWQYAAWTAVALMAGALYWQGRIMSAEPKVYHPITTMRVALDPRARDQYIGGIKAFAEAFGFTAKFGRTSPDPNDVVVKMTRADMWIVGGMASRLGGPDLAYAISFYGPKDQPVAPAVLKPAVEGLKRYLGGVAGVVITEVKAPK